MPWQLEAQEVQRSSFHLVNLPFHNGFPVNAENASVSVQVNHARIGAGFQPGSFVNDLHFLSRSVPHRLSVCGHWTDDVITRQDDCPRLFFIREEDDVAGNDCRYLCECDFHYR